MTEAAALQAALKVYSAELVRWGERMNLVGSTEPEAIARHIADSLAACADLPRNARVADLGSGAGLPGLPIAIARPDLRVTLVEIREKRLAFLRHVVRELGLSVEVRAASIDLPPEEPFDFALLRAVANPAKSLQIGRAWVHAMGEVWIWTGPSAELESSRTIPLASGGRILRFLAADFSRGTS